MKKYHWLYVTTVQLSRYPICTWRPVCSWWGGGRRKRRKASERYGWLTGIFMRQRGLVACKLPAASQINRRINWDLGVWGFEEPGVLPRSICSSVVLKLQELACAPENKVGSPEQRAVIRGQSGVPSLPCHPFYRVGSGGRAVTVTAQPHLRPATLKPEKTQRRRVNSLHIVVRRPPDD